MQYDYSVMWGKLLGQKGISLERMQTLCLVADAGSIATAAKGDPNRQSLFSRQIKELETALGIQLLERSSTPHRLTPAAMKLDQTAREFFNGCDNILATFSGEAPTITIGAGESIIQWLLLPALGRFVTKHDLSLRFRNLTSRQVSEALRARRIELGVTTSDHLGPDLQSAPLATYGTILIGRESVIGPGRKTAWRSLDGIPLATLEGTGRLRSKIDALTAAHDRGPKIRLECTSHPQLLACCSVGNHAAIVPEIAARFARSAKLTIKRVGELKDFTTELRLAWAKKPDRENPPLASVVDHLLGRSG